MKDDEDAPPCTKYDRHTCPNIHRNERGDIDCDICGLSINHLQDVVEP